MPAHLVKPLLVLFWSLLLVLGQFAGHAAAGDTDVTVNDSRDLPDPSPNRGPDCESTAGTCTLRAAIQRANHQIGTHIIRLPPGTFAITRAGNGENDAKTGDFDIKGKIIIRGAGAKETVISGSSLDRVFDVRRGSLQLIRVTVRDGRTANEEDGGGIRALGAALTLDRVHLQENRAGADGGGVWANNDLSVLRSTISNNQAGRDGGGIYVKSTFNVLRPSFSVRDSTISGNTLRDEVSDVGGIGGISASVQHKISISHSTIAFNEGIGLAMVAFPNYNIDHTILANNGFNCLLIDNNGSTLDFNVDADATCGFFSDQGNLVNVDPQLAVLADNGGDTPTHVFNNPILQDAGEAAGPFCNNFDQRGLPRPVDFDGEGGARCDIGAIELQSPP